MSLIFLGSRPVSMIFRQLATYAISRRVLKILFRRVTMMATNLARSKMPSLERYLLSRYAREPT